jgi:hypothetical protein
MSSDHVLTVPCWVSAVLLVAVMLMSLRAQLQAPQGNTRPIIAAQLNTDNLHDSTRCNVLLWVPRSNGSQFLAGHASGNVILYKKVCAAAAPDRNRPHFSAATAWHTSGIATQLLDGAAFMLSHLAAAMRLAACARSHKHWWTI